MRADILDAIYTAEQQLGTDSQETTGHPVRLRSRTSARSASAPSCLSNMCWVNRTPTRLAVTAQYSPSVHSAAETELEQEATQYRSEIAQKKTDLSLGQRLYDGLLGGIPEVQETRLDRCAGWQASPSAVFRSCNSGQYVLTSHLVTVVPSGTVLDILRHRADQTIQDDLPYVGVAAWISKAPPTTLLATHSSGRFRPGATRTGRPARRAATKWRPLRPTFRSPAPFSLAISDRDKLQELPLNQYNVIHLALHGYADPEFPDRSALVFAPQIFTR